MNTDIWSATLAPGLDEGASRGRSPLLDAKVMMVDDEPLMTELIQAHLEDAGYNNFVATNDPVTALELLRRERPGLLLLDLMMPRMSGFEILEALRADRTLRYTPVIVLTAATNAESKLRALQLGATDFLGKPVDASELVLRVRNTLAFQQYHERQIHYDNTTRLPNERLFERNIDALLASGAPREGALTALFSIVIPECQELRESLGRPLANALAVVLARRLERFHGNASKPQPGQLSVERDALVARLGEQHFGIVIEGLANSNDVVRTAKALLAVLSEPVNLGDHEAAPNPWIGVALAPGDGNSAGALRQSADLAVTHGRRQGTAPINFASPELNAQSLARLTLGSQLRYATQRNELRLQYQPKVQVATGRLVGVEALVRWQHPEQGLLPPGKFIPLSEELGLIANIGQWVLNNACREAARWLHVAPESFTVAVNVSKLQVTSGDLGKVVRQALQDSGLPAQRLVIELTESMLVEDAPHCLSLMHELKAIGVTLSIDDFGTGYSSLSYLKRFPLDELKIDRSFIADLPGRPTDSALVRTVIELGHSLGMSVTAEGVETSDQLTALRALGCDLCQGFYFGRPMSMEQCLALLDTTPAPGAVLVASLA